MTNEVTKDDWHRDVEPFSQPKSKIQLRLIVACEELGDHSSITFAKRVQDALMVSVGTGREVAGDWWDHLVYLAGIGIPRHVQCHVCMAWTILPRHSVLDGKEIVVCGSCYERLLQELAIGGQE